MKITTCSIADSDPHLAGAASARSSTRAGAARDSRLANTPAAAPARSRSRRVTPSRVAPAVRTLRALPAPRAAQTASATPAHRLPRVRRRRAFKLPRRLGRRLRRAVEIASVVAFVVEAVLERFGD